MLPAHQRLTTQQLAVGVDLGLVIGHKLLGLHTVAHLALQIQPFGILCVHGLGKQLIRIAPGRLGRIHRRIGIAHQDIWRIAIGREKHTPMLGLIWNNLPSSSNGS